MDYWSIFTSGEARGVLATDFKGLSIRLGIKWHISFLMYYSDWGLWQFGNHDLNVFFFIYRLRQHDQADKYLSSAKAQPFGQWCASGQDLSPCFPMPVVSSEVPSKAGIHGTMTWSVGISLVWALLANMSCFTHMSITRLAMYNEPRVPDICTENWVSFAVNTHNPSVLQYGKGRIFTSLCWDQFMILISRSHFPVWWPAELTCMSQMQQT